MKTLLFVDDEPKVLQGLERQLHSMRGEWKLLFAESAAQALQRMAATRVDVVVTDMMMPGMDGAELLDQVMRLYPNAVRLVLSGHADQETVLRLVGPAHQYLSKPCNAEDLRAAITRTLALRDLLDSQLLRELVSRIPCLPSLPSLHNEITAELRKEDPSVERVSQIISRDIAMTGKILQLVNSAFFGLSHPVANVSEAVLYLGLTTVRALVFSVQIFSQFDGRAIKEFSLDDLSRHCWKTGVFARRIAQAEHGDAKIDDHCFLAGLLHDLGHLILATGLPEQYSPLLREARASGTSIVELEQKSFGATHAEVGAHLLGLWGLPMPVIEAVALHHQPSAGPAHGLSAAIVVRLADAFACGKLGVHPEPSAGTVDLCNLAAWGFGDSIERWRELCLREPA
jgi:HD-like signal output (HDOD) protein/CheY-like chemotaxis protein